VIFSDGLGPQLRGLQQGADGIDQSAAIGTQFDDALFDHLLQEFFAAWEKLHEDLTAVFAARDAFDVGVGFHAVDELHSAVVPERKAVG
jgi:primosomal protein N''